MAGSARRGPPPRRAAMAAYSVTVAGRATTGGAGKAPLPCRQANRRATAIRPPKLRAGAVPRLQSRCVAENQERESSESPMLKAFWRVAPSVLFSFLAICDAEVFLRAIDFKSRTSLEVHERRFFFRLAIMPPFQESQLVSLTDVKEKPIVGRGITLVGRLTFASRATAHRRSWNSRQ